MAALSAIRNKKNQKLREAIEDITAKCGDKASGDGVKVELLVNLFEDMNIHVDKKEMNKLENLQDIEKKISK